MGKLNLAYFMARRMTTATGGSKNNVMVKIAMLSVAIGAAVMIIALAVIFGFKQEIVGRLSGVGAHVQITHLEGNTSYETAPISRNQPFLDHLSEVQHLKGVYPYAITIGIPQGDKAVSGVIFKGVDSTFDDSFFAQHLVAGTLPRHSDSVRYKDLLISRKLANLLEIEVGDPLRMLFLQQSPRRDRFRISGIYDAAYGELDQIVLTDLSNVQHLNGWDSTQVSGFELTTSDFSRLEEFTDQIYDAVIEAAESEEAHDSLRVENLRERFPMIFDWLNAHNVNAAVIITVMLLVALFNMITALLIIVLERTAMIGTLKALGMSNGALQRLFLLRSSFIILKGILWGNLIGIGLCLLQHYTGWIKLDAEGYFLSVVPIALHWGTLLLADLAAFLLLVGLLALPTMIISLILPEKTIRFE